MVLSDNRTMVAYIYPKYLTGYHSFVSASQVNMSQKRKTLTLEERIRVFERSGKGEAARCIASDLNVGKTQIQNIIKDKVSFLCDNYRF